MADIEKINVRPANTSDINELLKFEQGVIAAERPFDPTLKEETVYYNLQDMINADHIEVVVAEFNKALIGCGYARIEPAPDYLIHHRYAYMAYMYVLPEYRRQGVNRMIIESLKTWSRGQGLSELRLKVYTENEGAISAYEKAGFKPLALEMRMNLND